MKNILLSLLLIFGTHAFGQTVLSTGGVPTASVVAGSNITITQSGSTYTVTANGGTGTVTQVNAGTNLTITAGSSTVNPTLSVVATPTITGTNITGLPLSTGVTGILPLANGGTNASLAASNGSVVYSTAAQYSFTPVGSANQVMISNGAAAPTWTGLSSLVNSGTNITITGTTTPTVSLTGTVSVTNGGTGLASCSQGDLFYGSGTNTIAKLAKSASASNFLKNSGSSNNPAWAQPATTDLSDVATGTFTPTYTGFSSNPTALARYTKQGNLVTVVITTVNRGTSNATTFTITNLPYTSNSTSNYIQEGYAIVSDNGTWQNSGGIWVINPGTTIVGFGYNSAAAAGGFTNSGSKGAIAVIQYHTD